MAKLRSSKFNEEEKIRFIGDIFTIALKLGSKKELASFFRDLLFDSEVIMLGRRLQIAIMLLSNKTYDEIQRELKVGINTVASVRFSLDHGTGAIIKALQKNKS